MRRAAGDRDPRQPPSEVVLVPVKAFGEAKLRLARALPARERARLARSMAERVLAAAHPLPVAVVCEDGAVAAWAESLGAIVLAEPGRGLNGAVSAGVERLRRDGAERVTVAHADLPLATDLTWLGAAGGVTIVPDRHGTGSNVVSIPAGSGFRFSYGPRSLGRHLAEAQRLGLPVHVLRDPSLSWDVDVPADLVMARGLSW